MTFIKWLELAELDRNLYLTSRGDNLLTLTESFSCHRNPVVSPAAIRIWFKTGWTRTALTQPHELIYGDFISRNNRNYRSYIVAHLKSLKKKCSGEEKCAINFGRKKIHFRRMQLQLITIASNFLSVIEWIYDAYKTNLICLSKVTKWIRYRFIEQETGLRLYKCDSVQTPSAPQLGIDGRSSSDRRHS